MVYLGIGGNAAYQQCSQQQGANIQAPVRFRGLVDSPGRANALQQASMLPAHRMLGPRDRLSVEQMGVLI